MSDGDGEMAGEILPGGTFEVEGELPEELPGEPFTMVEAWLGEALERRATPNPNAMTLATIDPDGRPSARIVLLKGLEVERGCAVFYTNRESRKGEALAANPVAALVLHFDAFDRQVRIEGQVTRTTDAESDAYFFSRHPASRVGAWASDQSRPIGSRDELLMKVMEAMGRFGIDLDSAERVGEGDVPRPPHWGGYRVWAESVELWVGNAARVHDRARWTREVRRAGEGCVCGGWSVTRLQP